MTERLLKLFPLLAVCSLAGCVSMPTGPSMMALPGNGRSFDEFRYDDYVCRQFAYEQAGGTPTRASVASGVGSAAVGAGLGAAAGAALGGGRGAAIGAGTGMLAGGLAGANTARASGSVSQQRYDMGYTQCMYAKGHRVPVSGQVQYSPAPSYSSAPSAPSAPSMPPPPPRQAATSFASRHTAASTGHSAAPPAALDFRRSEAVSRPATCREFALMRL